MAFVNPCKKDLVIVFVVDDKLFDCYFHCAYYLILIEITNFYLIPPGLNKRPPPRPGPCLILRDPLNLSDNL